MSPIDDPSISALGPLAKVRRELVTGIPSQAVEALREEFQQALKDAAAHPERDPRDHPKEPPQDGGDTMDQPAEDLAPPEVYGPHGEPPKPPDTHRLDLEG